MMFGFGPATRIYVPPEPRTCARDLKGFNGLYGLVRDHLGCDPESGHVFLFTNARRNRLKLLVYDHSGLWICSKKLDGGRFRWPGADTSVTKIILSHEELALLLGGIDLAETRRRKWYRKPLTEKSEKLPIPA
jgi:transposase